MLLVPVLCALSTRIVLCWYPYCVLLVPVLCAVIARIVCCYRLHCALLSFVSRTQQGVTMTPHPLSASGGPGVHALGCSERLVRSVAEGLAVVQEATQRRTVATTAGNQHSSRSHALVSVKVGILIVTISTLFIVFPG